MSCIHFKFKSSLEYEKVTFDGLQISLGDLKEAIMKQKKIGGANQYTLSVKDAQSKKVYKDDSEMLSRNSSVIISRVPLVNAPKIPKTQLQDPSLPQPASSSTAMKAGAPSTSLPALTSETKQGKLTVEELSKTADLATANATEEEKVIAMMNQSAEGYNPSQYVKFHPRRGGAAGMGVVTKPPPPSYRCYRCGQPGHYINVCPTNGDPNFDNYRYKPVRGTPSNQVIQVPADVPGAMLDRHGNLVVRAVDYQAYLNAQMKGKKTAATVEAPKEAEIPRELLCSLCKELVRDAVIIPCCGESFCYGCIQEYLCENEFTCPACKTADVSPERLAPNKALRTSAKNFQLKAAEQKSEAVARGFIKQAPLPNILPTATTVTAAQPTSTTVTPSQPSQAPTTTASTTLTTSTSQSLESTTSTSTDTAVSSQSQTSASVNGPSEESVKTTEAPSVTVTVEDVATTTTASLGTTSLDIAKSGLVTQAKGELEKAMLNGLAGITAGSVPVVKADPLAHYLGPSVLAPQHTQLAGLLPHRLLQQPTVNNTDNLERLAADLLLGATKKSPSPPPLTADEFYRQQKLLQLLTKKPGSRSNTPGSNSSLSGSDSNDSRTRSWSYDSRSRTRSRSPHYKKKTKKSRSHRHSKRSEKDHERSKHRSHHKRSRHGSKERKEEGTRRGTKRHRSPSVSPERKRMKESVALSQGELPLPLNETPAYSGGEEEGRASRKHKHKKRGKRKHRHRSPEGPAMPADGEASVESIMDVEASQPEAQTKDTASQDTIVSQSSDALTSQTAESVETELAQESSQSVSSEIVITNSPSAPTSQNQTCSIQNSKAHISSAPSSDTQSSSAPSLDTQNYSVPSSDTQPSVPSSSNPSSSLNTDTQKSSRLVPYQDSSTTEAEQTGDTTEAELVENTTQTATSEIDEEEEALLLDVHIDGNIDKLDVELGVASSGQSPETEEDDDVTPKEEETQSGEADKEEGEISDSGDSGTTTPPPRQSQPKLSSSIQLPHSPSPQEDLRVEIERAKQKRKRELESSQSDALVDPILPPITTPTKHTAVKKSHKAAKVAAVSSDEYDSSSSSESVDSELERLLRKKAHKAKKLKRKHSTSKSRDRREKELKSKKKKERSKSKKDSRDRKLKKDKLSRDKHRVLKKSEKSKKSKSSSRR